MRLLRITLCLFVLSFAAAAQAPPAPATPAPDADIRAVLNQQVIDWNRGNLDGFATGYKNSPDILFIGRSVRRGYAQMLAAYRSGYATPAAMGQLSFTDLEVQPLDERFATVTGHFHLERTTAGGGNADGFFLLVMEKTPEGWKIVRDDSTAAPPPTAH